MKILTIIGARPQFIKAAIVSKKMKESNFISEIIVHTGQHFDLNMDKIFFDELSIPAPKYNLGINSVSHGEMTGRMIIEIEKIILLEKPDFVLVYGDTNSTLAGALAAKKLHMKIIHVEAGLRSFNMNMPEEINRILTDRISDILFCPTQTSVNNLVQEGYKNFGCEIVQNGDVMYDLALFMQKMNSVKEDDKKDSKKFVLCTIHREESTDNIKNLNSIFNALNRISREVDIFLPLHPRTKAKLKNNFNLNFKTHEPVGYFQMANLLANCSLVITDSGGLQKEAFFYKKNCVTIREQTEWQELINGGFNMLSGYDENDIYNSFREMISRTNNFNVDLYGNGNACQIIVNTLLRYNSQNSK
ncbi:MAG: UDP-N-acetylglucosamine 2-epimerase (non-hydrolyzing) [Ignavibacteriaceae bacterium]|nr:UDP-N-acetylglucosamine 2-epimerase (non-hydrolyzing) [Ignavibacteriaceae bacterium]